MRVGDAAAVLTYVGLVTAFSLACTIWPEASVACLSFSLALYLGFLAVDAIAPEGPARMVPGEPANVVVLKKP